MLQQESAEDFVIATGKQHTVKEFTNAVAEALEMEIHWQGEGVNEVGLDAHGNCIVQVDPSYFRPVEVENLRGDTSKAKEFLGWSPKTSFTELATEMAMEDLKTAKKEACRLNAPDQNA
ncbi:GDP-mannose 4,6-dehydratase, partial [Solemya elarraichensis gill symbiont]|uniref:GDP-mannose 4,6-dehydratase n=1 Tax=Solemya elarraichensis gill symbiont TaxID=1918949 RepID=A0A1T2L6A7_9GAMM